MNNSFKNIVNKAFVFFLLYSLQVTATHNTSRYFPFLERPEDYTIKKRSHFTPSFFYINASTAHRRGGSTGGIPELWGMYNLNDVIKSLREVNPAANPVFAVTGSNDLSGKSIAFRVYSKVRAVGAMVGYEHDFKWHGFQAGAWIPVLALNTTSRFNFDRGSSDSIFTNPLLTEDQRYAQELLVDKIRRNTHQTIGFEGNEFEKSGFGDLDLHVRWNHIFDHVLLMRSIDINLQAGITAPTGMLSTINVPPSLSVGADGHWGIYGDIVTEFELKQDITVGLMLGITHLFPTTRTLRIPVEHEPAIFSSLIGSIRSSPGLTLKAAPYFILGNLSDGLDFQVRYTYLHHAKDRWKDARSDKTIPSYLQKGSAVINEKEQLSKWVSQYISMQVLYDTKRAMKQCKFDPVCFAVYDIPIGGNGSSQTNQITIGVELHF